MEYECPFESEVRYDTYRKVMASFGLGTLVGRPFRAGRRLPSSALSEHRRYLVVAIRPDGSEGHSDLACEATGREVDHWLRGRVAPHGGNEGEAEA